MILVTFELLNFGSSEVLKFRTSEVQKFRIQEGALQEGAVQEGTLQEGILEQVIGVWSWRGLLRRSGAMYIFLLRIFDLHSLGEELFHIFLI